MRVFNVVPIAVLLVAGATLPADAGEASETKEIAPFVNGLTRGIIRVDLGRTDAAGMLELLGAGESTVPLLRLPFIEGLEQARRTLLEAEIERVYFIVTLAEAHRRPWYLVAPCPASLDPEALLPRLPDRPMRQLLFSDHLVSRTLGKDGSGRWLFLGDRGLFDQVKESKPSSRPELAAAFEAAGNAAVRMLLLPTDDDRRVVMEILSALPESLGGGPGEVLVRGLRWAAVGIDPGAEPMVNLVIHSADAKAADRFRHWLQEAAKQWDSEGLPTVGREILAGVAKVPGLMPRVEEDRLVLRLGKSNGTLAALHSVTAEPLSRLAARQTAGTRLQQIVFAMHSWHDRHQSLPAQANYDANGEALLSWRVHLLPFLGDEYKNLYKEFRIDEPWDSDHNGKLVARMPEIYAMPGSNAAAEGRTCFLRPVGPDTSCPGKQTVSIADITDGTVSTIAVIEVDEAHAVPWTKPADLDYDPEHPTEGLGGHIDSIVFAATCDGAPHFLEKIVNDPDRQRDLRAIFGRADGQVVRRID